MLIALNALLPIIGLILLGSLLKKLAFLDDSLWPQLEKLCYYVLTPVLLVYILSTKQMGETPWAEIALAATLPIFLAASVFWLYYLLSTKGEAARFTSFFQGGVRFNTFVGLAIIQNLYGASGLVVAALASGFMIILINLLCVTTFSLTLNKGGNIFKTVTFQIIKNPLIIGCIVGMALNASPFTLPTALTGTLELIGRAGLPMALISIGAALKIELLFSDKQAALGVSFMQFIFKPAVAIMACYMLGLNGITAASIILFFTVPTAPSSFILARQLGGDHQIMASIITQQTFLSFLSIPLTIWAISQIGFLQ